MEGRREGDRLSVAAMEGELLIDEVGTEDGKVVLFSSVGSAVKVVLSTSGGIERLSAGMAAGASVVF